MADKKIKLSIKKEIIFWLVVFSYFFSHSGCASQTKQQMDSNYRAQAEQDYPCPHCGQLIPMKNVSENIRIENKCPNCQKIFFGTPKIKKSQERKQGERGVSYGLKSHGPRSVYESDTDYQYFWTGGESFKETPTGYSFLYWHFRDSKVKSHRVIPHWTTTRYGLMGR